MSSIVTCLTVATNEGHGRQTLDNMCVCVIELLAVMTGMSLCVQEMVYRLDIAVMRYKIKKKKNHSIRR